MVTLPTQSNVAKIGLRSDPGVSIPKSQAGAALGEVAGVVGGIAAHSRKRDIEEQHEQIKSDNRRDDTNRIDSIRSSNSLFENLYTKHTTERNISLPADQKAFGDELLAHKDKEIQAHRAAGASEDSLAKLSRELDAQISGVTDRAGTESVRLGKENIKDFRSGRTAMAIEALSSGGDFDEAVEAIKRSHADFENSFDPNETRDDLNADIAIAAETRLGSMLAAGNKKGAAAFMKRPGMSAILGPEMVSSFSARVNEPTGQFETILDAQGRPLYQIDRSTNKAVAHPNSAFGSGDTNLTKISKLYTDLDNSDKKFGASSARSMSIRSVIRNEAQGKPAKPDWQIFRTEDGTIASVNVATPDGAAEATTLVESGATPMAKGDIKLTDAQAKSGGFALRMNESNNVIGKFGDQFADILSIGEVLSPNFLQGADMQRFNQAGEDFSSALLRRESGAVIGVEEAEKLKRQYIPQVGDTSEVIAQKARNRQSAFAGVKLSAGPAYAQGQRILSEVREASAPLPPGVTEADITATMQETNMTRADILQQFQGAQVDTSAGPQDGATATNPTTGEKMTFRGGQWQAL